MIDGERLAELRKVAAEFVNVDKIVEIRELNGGHINSTYLITMPEALYILQRINNFVFPSPFGVMHNITEVTEFIRKKVIYEGKDPNRAVLNVVKSRYDQDIVIRNDNYWRCLQYIDGATAYQNVDTPEMFAEIGRAIGEFQCMLSGFHTRVLDETIIHFHDTPYRYRHFLDDIKIDRVERVAECKKEIKAIRDRASCMNWITLRIDEKIIPRRVAHNDTKPSNVLIDDKTGKAICLIDLDTVMRGSLLFDFGDAIRIGACTAEEDEVDLSRVHVRLDFFEAFTRAFLKEVKNLIVPEEVKGLYKSCQIIALEIAMRFLNDYINGDEYFKIARPKHNLERARCQLQFVKELEKNEQAINDIIRKILEELDFGPEYTLETE